MRPKAEWTIDSEPIQARGIIVYKLNKEKRERINKVVKTFILNKVQYYRGGYRIFIRGG